MLAESSVLFAIMSYAMLYGSGQHILRVVLQLTHTNVQQKAHKLVFHRQANTVKQVLGEGPEITNYHTYLLSCVAIVCSALPCACR